MTHFTIAGLIGPVLGMSIFFVVGFVGAAVQKPRVLRIWVGLVAVGASDC